MPYKDPEKQRKWIREYARKWRKENPEKAFAARTTPEALAYRKAYCQSHRKERCEISLRYIARHPEKVKERERRYHLEHPEKRRAAIQKWANAHREYINKKRREWRTKHREQIIILNAVNYMLRAAKVKKKCRSIEYIGCSPQALREHIGKQFREGMTWENHGPVWHVDHIIPVSWWDFKNEPDAIFKASHYSNLQPLFAKENCAKGARYAG